MINLNIDNNETKIDSNYDYEVYQEIKKVPNATYSLDRDIWIIDTAYLKHLIKTLNDMNKNVKHIIPELKNINKEKKYQYEEKDNVIKTVRIKVLKENPKSLVIGFDYDPKVLDVIKQVDGRSYVAKSKAWRIGKGNEDWLYNKLDELGYVELSDLLPYTSHNSRQEISLNSNDFPYSSINPYPFQLDVASKLVNQKKIINALEAGLGKTAITIMACEYLKKKTLIITPATVKYNWEKEIYQINHNANVVVLDSKSKWQDADYVILNYDIVDRFLDNIKNTNFEIIAFDEAHKLRGVNNRGIPSSKRAKLCLEIAKNIEYIFPITATPFINQTKDIFNLMVLVDHPSSDNWYTFANTYCGAERTDFGVSYNGSSNQEQLNNRLYPNYMIRLKTEDHVDLPGRIRRFTPLKINMNKYNKAVKEYMDNRNSYESNGKHLVHLQAMRLELAKEKSKQSINMIKDLLEQNKSVVVFSNYKEIVNNLYNKFKNDAVVIHGDISEKERQKAVELFQNGSKSIFIGSIGAASEGITLTKSHHMIVIDFHWSPVVMVNQMEKRIDRIGQNHRCIIDYLYVPDAKMDQIQLEMLEEKLNDSSLIVDGKKEDFFIDKIINNL